MFSVEHTTVVLEALHQAAVFVEIAKARIIDNGNVAKLQVGQRWPACITEIAQSPL